ncbi:indole-3-glycerol phosphate synthase [[Clostridium] methylpentosum DSM 5476]|uniref:Indole-3-glycerol phosphate synthase n=1 Tax=[Clostridium] methylpentosum DSM 5476 TaxID=537013 RepID=C0EA58_9FIRM|nr:indole-3-glycerol phosphate synthase [[Clostridium] methylpentosum DSM 5476]
MILDQIVAKKAIRLEQRKREKPLSQLKSEALKFGRTPLDFTGALKEEGLSIIAEVKKASPSKGVIRRDFDPLAIAREYLSAGVQAMSVLTEEDFFQGSDQYLREIREIADIPLLRKDFIIDEYQIYEAYLLGADAVLLIAALLDPPTMLHFYELATSLGLHCLTEVHNQEELDQVLRLGMPIVGINNRNLHDFSEDIHTTERLVQQIPEGRVVVSESAIRTPEDIRLVREFGADAALIGEAFMRNPDVKQAVAELRDADE